MTNNLLLFLMILGNCVLTSYGQNINKQRLEFNADKLKEEHHVVAVGEEGVVLIHKGGKEFKENEIVLEKYDVNFKKEWSKTLPNPGYMRLTKYTGTNKFLYVLLIGNENRKHIYKVIQVDLKTGSFKNIVGLINQVEINELSANGQQVFFGGILKEGILKYKGILFCVDFETMESSKNPVEFEMYSDLAHIKESKQEGG